MRKLAIWDLDGTAIDSSHRYRTLECGTKIDLKHWRENCTPEQIAKDVLLPHSNQMIKDLEDANTMVVIATARVMQKADFDYIIKNLGIPNYIIHREPDDNRKGVDLKNSGIAKYVGDVSRFEHITIYEDNLEYLQGMTQFLEAQNPSVYPVYVPSNQGH
jgi:hypothetical protein